MPAVPTYNETYHNRRAERREHQRLEAVLRMRLRIRRQTRTADLAIGSGEYCLAYTLHILSERSTLGGVLVSAGVRLGKNYSVSQESMTVA